LLAGGSPAAGIFLLLAQEKGTPFRRPCGVPCVARQAGRLRKRGTKNTTRNARDSTFFEIPLLRRFV